MESNVEEVISKGEEGMLHEPGFMRSCHLALRPFWSNADTPHSYTDNWNTARVTSKVLTAKVGQSCMSYLP
jgi:hypothetical protein